MYRILVVEDNYEELLQLTQYIKNTISNIQIDTAKTYEEAIHLINTNIYSCFFLDISLDDNNSENNGILIGYAIRNLEKSKHTPIVFITTVNSKIHEALNKLHCYEFISKPYSSDDIYNCVNSILGNPLCKQIILSYKDINGIIIKIHPQDIQYIKIKGHNSYIYGINNTYELNRVSLENFKEKLSDSFLRCHRSYLINSDHVENIDLTTMQISIGRHSIPIGRLYRDNIKEYFKI